MAELDEEPAEAEEQARLLAWDEEPRSTRYWNDETETFDYPDGWPPSNPGKPVSETWMARMLRDSDKARKRASRP